MEQTDNYGAIFSRRLKELRQELGLTIEEFAKAAGVSKSSVGYYESQNRVPDILAAGRMADVLNVSADYLIGRSNARTPKVKLKSVCDKIGLSDKSVLMLARLKNNNDTRLGTINRLLEQADSDIEYDYDLDGKYDGSVLNAICRYLDRYHSMDEFLMDITSSSDEGITSSIQSAMYQLILNQVIDALREQHNNPYPAFEPFDK